MKLIIIILLLFTSISQAQERSKLQLKKANRIIIVTNRPAADNYKLIQSALDNAGYTIEYKNDDSLKLRTAETFGKSATVSYRLESVAKPNEIILNGIYYSKVEGSIGGTNQKVFANEIINKGKKGSITKFTFDAMDEVAKMMNGQVFYMIVPVKVKAVFK